MNKPTVTIGLPVFNGEIFLAQAVDSLLAQTDGDFELIISDNGSTDGTERICRQFEASDRRVRYLRFKENRGAAWNYNNVFSVAESDLFKWAADDDICAPTYLEKCRALLHSNQEAVIAFTGAPHIDTSGEVLGEGEFDLRVGHPDAAVRFRDLVLQYHDCRPIFGLIRRQALEDSSLIGSFDGADRTLLVELGMKGPFIEAKEPLLQRRIHPNESERSWRGRHRERAEWYDPQRTGKAALPEWRLAGAYLKAIRHSSQEPKTKIRCYKEMLRWLRWGHGRSMVADLTYALAGRYRRTKTDR